MKHLSIKLPAFLIAFALAPGLFAQTAVVEKMAPVPTQRAVFAQFELSANVLPAIGEANHSSLATSYAGRFGLRLPRSADFFCVLEHNLWFGSDLASTGIPHVLNWGGGMGFILRQTRVRTSFAAGASTLLFDTTNADAGSTGLFIDARPLALRLRTKKEHVLEIVFVSFQASIPKIEGIPIIHLEFRTALTLEIGMP